MRVLYVSATIPYDNVPHAGGQTLNYYIKNMSKNKQIEVSLVSYCSSEDLKKCDVEKSGIFFYPIEKKGGVKDFIGNCLSVWSKVNPLHKFGNIMTTYSSYLLINKLNTMKDNGYYPEVIILEWTQILLQIKQIKKIFPNAKFVASEHDVTFLGKERMYNNEKKIIPKLYRRLQAKNMRKRELKSAQLCDCIYTHNYKDEQLLVNAGITPDFVKVLVPYYHRTKLDYNRKNNDIVFYGNMKRKENYSAAIWFIENVMPLLKDLDVRFVIIGSGPTEELLKKQNDKVIVTGYVDTIDKYFSEAMCFVAPLMLGAGIKIKVLEALYTGIPVLTNEIGIEGIRATNNKDYYHCIEASDYARQIKRIYNGDNVVCGKDFIEREVFLEKSFNSYFSTIFKLCGYERKEDVN